MSNRRDRFPAEREIKQLKRANPDFHQHSSFLQICFVRSCIAQLGIEVLHLEIPVPRLLGLCHRMPKLFGE
jgi:hypothetical protein